MRVDGDPPSAPPPESKEVRDHACLIAVMVDQVLAGRAAHGRPRMR